MLQLLRIKKHTDASTIAKTRYSITCCRE